MILALFLTVLLIIWAVIPLIYGIMSWWWFISSVGMIILGLVIIKSQFKREVYVE